MKKFTFFSPQRILSLCILLLAGCLCNISVIAQIAATPDSTPPDAFAMPDVKVNITQLARTDEIRLHFRKNDSIYLSDMMRQINMIHQIKKTSTSANIGLGFSVVTNVSLLINARMYDANIDDVSKGIVGLIGGAFGMARLVISFATIRQIKVTNEMLAASGNSFWNDYQIEQSKKHLKTAKNATVAIPVLGIAGVGLIAGGIVGIGNDNTAGYVSYSLGWACAIGGLTCSIIASSQLTKVKKILEAENGSLNLSMSSNGVGLCYRMQ